MWAFQNGMCRCLISDLLFQRFQDPPEVSFRAGCQTRWATVPGLGFEPLGPGEVQVAIDSIDPGMLFLLLVTGDGEAAGLSPVHLNTLRLRTHPCLLFGEIE